MKKIMCSIIVASAFVITSCGGETKPADHKQGGHNYSSDKHEENHSSPSFFIIDAYLSVKNGLVSDDGESTAKAALRLMESLDNVKKEVSKDNEKEVSEILESIKENAEHISTNASEIAHQREHFLVLSRDVKDLISIMGTPKSLYQEFCPMYKNDGGMWLSDKKEIENPYFGASMLNCGSVQEEISTK